MTVLGISIGTMQTGVCVLRNGEMIDRDIHRDSRMWSDKKLRKFLRRYNRLIDKHKVEAVVIKIPPIERHNEPITKLISGVEELALRFNCKFDLITKYEIKQRLLLKNTEEIIKYARLLFPGLSATYQQGTRNKHCNYIKMYEAVLAAYLYHLRRKA